MQQAPLKSLLNKRFVLVMGKGGTGKTTTAASIAVAAANAGKRTLVALCNHHDHISSLFGAPNLTTSIQTISHNIDAVNMEPGAALSEYGALIVKNKTISKLIFENRWLRRVLLATPGIESWSMLGKAYYHTREKTGLHNRYDLVIVDAPSTGHSLEMLSVPRVISQVAPSSLLKKDADEAWKLISNPEKTSIVIVALLEELPTTEALELTEKLSASFKLHPSLFVLNKVLKTIWPSEISEQLKSASTKLGPRFQKRNVIKVALNRILQEEEQKTQQKRLSASLALPQITFPLVIKPALELEDIRKFASHLSQ